MDAEPDVAPLPFFPDMGLALGFGIGFGRGADTDFIAFGAVTDFITCGADTDFITFGTDTDFIAFGAMAVRKLGRRVCERTCNELAKFTVSASRIQ